MNTQRKEILLEVIGDVKQSAKILQFPVSKPETKPEHKVASMACHRCEMMDWNFSRGW